LALGYAALAGFADAIGFLKSGGLFVSFMSGNSTRLAIGLAEQEKAGIAALSLIALFVLGVVLAALLGFSVPTKHRKFTAVRIPTIPPTHSEEFPPGDSDLIPPTYSD
jgi:uncharacterized membrane protein YoaK (UPF0700 family)